MISRLKDSNNNKGIALITDPNTEEEISYCPDCSQYHNKLHRLGPLIILDDKTPLPADYDNWKQCGYCYRKVPIYEVRHEGMLHTDIEGVRNPFDTVAKIKGVHKKGLANRMKDIAKKTKKKEQNDYSNDKEVMQEVKDGAKITGYYSTAPVTDKSI